MHGLAGYAEPFLIRHLGRDEADTRVFFNKDFADPERAPPDLADNPRYGRKISMDWPVFKVPSSMSLKPLHDDIQAAAALLPSMRAMYQSRESMLYRIFVTLESGVHVAYPGRGGFPADYDGRLRPKYRL